MFTVKLAESILCFEIQRKTLGGNEMLKIEKFSNVYGIKKLINPQLIRNNSLIYAPNGVMKSSFRDGFIDLKNGVNSRDMFNSLEADVLIEYDGQRYDSSSTNKLNVVVFDSELSSQNIFTLPDIASLVMSDVLRKKYTNEIDKMKVHTSRIIELYASNVTEEKRGSSKTEMLIRDLYPGKDIVESITNLNLKTNGTEVSLEKYNKIDFSTVNNDNVRTLLSDDKFVENCNLYLSIVNAKIDEHIFKEGFGIEELKSITKSLSANNYFKAGHRLMINNVEYSNEEINLLITETIRSIYDDVALEPQFLIIKKTLTKNKDTKGLLALIEKDKSIISDLKDVSLLKERIIYSKLYDYHTEINQIKVELGLSKSRIDEILLEASKERTIWDNVITIFNDRFWSATFHVEIGNRADALIGRVLPTFVFTVKDSGTPVTEEVFTRFSTGEKRSIFILNMIFQIEIMKSYNKPFIAILDDVADSFDYKNKYAIIEYIRELQSEELILLIILTHNYDFFRSVKISCNNIESKLLAYKGQDGIDLYEANNKQLYDYSYFNSWKNEGNISSMLALIPLARNMIQLEFNGSHPEYINATQYLHYTSISDSLLLGDLEQLYIKYGVLKTPGYQSMNFVDTLFSEAETILRKTTLKETNIKEKLILGIFLRVFSEKLLYDSYKMHLGCNPNIPFDNHYSTKLLEGIKVKLNEDELKVVETIRVIAPSFIHVNSFMYEPLIDIGTERMKVISSDLIRILNSRAQ